MINIENGEIYIVHIVSTSESINSQTSLCALAIILMRILLNAIWFLVIPFYTTSQICKTFVLYFGKVEPLITENQLLFAFQTFVFTIFEGK